MRIEGLHHVAIIASDYARSKHFYTEVLGLRVHFGPANDDRLRR